jgi:hypothetical protein
MNSEEIATILTRLEEQLKPFLQAHIEDRLQTIVHRLMTAKLEQRIEDVIESQVRRGVHVEIKVQRPKPRRRRK